MKRTQFTGGNTERLVLTGMIVKRQVLAAIADKWKEPGLFPEPWSNIVGQWCVDYYNQYGDAPKNMVEPLFEKWSKKHKDKDTVGIVQSFLGKLSSEYVSLRKKINAKYVIDEAKDLFTKAQLIDTKEKIEEYLEIGDLKKAQSVMNRYNQIEMGHTAGFDPFSKSAKAIIQNAFEQQNETLITYKGAVGSFFGKQLCRGNFISLMGPEKRGKTWMLLEFAMKGVLQGRKVAFFEVGDMSQAQITRRLMVRVAKRPLDKGEVRIPVGIMPNEPMCDVEEKTKTFKGALTWEQAWKKTEKIMKKGKEDHLRIYTYPNDSISAIGIREQLVREKRNGWVPDIVIIDYADIIASNPGFIGDSRDSINSTWKTLRSINLENDNLLITATQSDAQSYDAKTLSKKHFSNDKRKFAHVTGMIGLNCSDLEKEVGIMRMNWIVLREGQFLENKCVHVAGSFGIARPIMYSTF